MTSFFLVHFRFVLEAVGASVIYVDVLELKSSESHVICW